MAPRALAEAIVEQLADAGFEGYEISNFSSAPEHRSKHNQKYWDHTPYLGLGPSAHSFDGRRRWWNERGLGSWSARLMGERWPHLLPEHRVLLSRESLRTLLHARGFVVLATGPARKQRGMYKTMKGLGIIYLF